MFRWVSDGNIQAFKIEWGLSAAEAKTLKLKRDKNTLIRSHKKFTYLHPFAFVFIHEAQIPESFPHIEGSLPMIDLYTVYVRVISELQPCWPVRLQVRVYLFLYPWNLCLISPVWQIGGAALEMPPKVEALSRQTAIMCHIKPLTVVL